MSTLLERIRAHHRLSHHLGFWFHLDYRYPGLDRYAKQLGIVPDRGKRILSNLAREGLIRRRDIHIPTPATFPELRRFHSQEYLDQMSRPDQVRKIFGLEPEEIPWAELLKAQQLAVGGTLAGMEWAIQDPKNISINLGGGFHHAEPNSGCGFCAYNDIAVGIAHLRKLGFLDKIAIIDLDYHQGNGNNVAFANDRSVVVFSLYGSPWTHVKNEQDFDLQLEGSVDDENYLDTLDATLPVFLEAHQPRLMVYIAGTDLLAQDPNGTFSLSLKGLFQRDRMVIDWARHHNVPLVITLAGGYGHDAGQATLNLCSYLLGVRHEVHYRDEGDVHERFEEIGRQIDSHTLQREVSTEFYFNEEDYEGALQSEVKHHRILDFFTRPGIENALERYGLLQKIRSLGYRDLQVRVDPTDATRQAIRIEGYPEMGGVKKPYLLAEIFFHQETLQPPAIYSRSKNPQVLSIEWILLQDPLRPFTLNNRPLPGQKYPGLGIMEEIQELFLQTCKRLQLDGILHRPAYYHIAFKTKGAYHFLNPKFEGFFSALKEVLKDFELDVASQAVAENKLILDNGLAPQWFPAEHIRPVSQGLWDYFDSRDYHEAVLEEKYRLLQEGLHLHP